MIESKAWEWENIKGEQWQEPSDKAYYLLHRWKNNNRQRLLDLGCGVGRHAIFFAENGFEVDAIDLSESAVIQLNEFCENNGLKINTKIGDMADLPYESSSFDYLLAYHTIFHTDGTGIKKVISEIHRVLSNDGEVFLTFNSKNNPDFHNPTNMKVDDNTIVKTEGIEKDIPHYYVDEEEIKNLISKFKIISFYQCESIKENEHSWYYCVLAKKVL